MSEFENRGKFIVFEGIDGSGKTTQARMLAEYLRARGREVALQAEPTTYETGKRLRSALKGEIACSETQMALLFVQDRIEHNIEAERGIESLLERGVDVISDRYYYSSLAYQGHSTDYEWVKSMNLNCPDIRRPDVCIYVDLLPHQSLERISRGRESVEIYENEQTLSAVRDKFLYVIKDLAGVENIRIVDGYRSKEEIAQEIARIVEG